MNIINITKEYVTISIILQIFKPSILDIFISLSIHFRSSIINDSSPELNPLFAHFTNFNQHCFVFNSTMIQKTVHALTRSPHGSSCFLAVVRQRRKSILCSESGTFENLFSIHRFWNNQPLWVSCTSVELSIVLQSELTIWILEIDTHSLGFIPDIFVDGPAIDIPGPVIIVYVYFELVDECIFESLFAWINEAKLFNYMVIF